MADKYVVFLQRRWFGEELKEQLAEYNHQAQQHRAQAASSQQAARRGRNALHEWGKRQSALYQRPRP